MKKELSFASAGMPSNIDAMAKNLSQLSNSGEGPTAFNGRELLKLTKQGEWIYGMDGVEAEGLIAVNPESFQIGFISWGKKSNVLGERMTPVTNPISRDELPDTGFDWDEQLQMELQIVSGPDEGVELIYKTTAHGGKEAVRNIARAIAGAIVDNPAYCVPVVKLETTNYKHKQYGKIYKPVFSIVNWASLSGDMLNPSNPEAGEQPIEIAGEATTTTEQTQGEATPRRRRRRA